MPHSNIYVVLPELNPYYNKPEQEDIYDEEDVFEKLNPIADYVETYNNTEETKVQNYIQFKKELINTFGIEEVSETKKQKSPSQKKESKIFSTVCQTT